MEYNDIVEYFKSLTPEKQRKVVEDLRDKLTVTSNNIFSSRESELEKTGLTCPSCSGNEIVGYGKYKDVKRFKCKGCGKTFNSLTGSVAYWIHKKDLLQEYLFFMLKGEPLRKIALHMDICLKTAFDWRHKVLNSLSSIDNSKFSGVIEADETFFLFSEKGNKHITGRKARARGGVAGKKGINRDHVTVLTVYERKTGLFINTVVCKGRITKKAITKGLSHKFDKEDGILCVDSHKSFEGYAMDNKINIKRIFVRRNEHVVEKIYHIQHVNSLHSNMKKWMKKFNGVSTKYLQNYMNYFSLVRSVADTVNQTEKALSKILHNNHVFIQRERINQQICIT